MANRKIEKSLLVGEFLSSKVVQDSFYMEYLLDNWQDRYLKKGGVKAKKRNVH